MYALCVSGAVNTQGFVWKYFMRYIKKNHSFICRGAGWEVREAGMKSHKSEVAIT